MIKELKTFKKFSTAKTYAEGEPVIRIGKLYLAGTISSTLSVDFIEPSGSISGTICMLHLSKGNHNHCKGDNLKDTYFK